MNRFFKSKQFATLAVVAVLLYVLWPLLKTLRSIGSTINNAGAHTLKALKGVDDHFGMDQDLNKEVIGYEEPISFWSPHFYANIFTEMGILPSSLEVNKRYQDLISEFKGYFSFWAVGRQYRLEEFFGRFKSQEDFAGFSYYWHASEGSELLEYLDSGWFFGLVGSLGNPELKRLNDIIRAKQLKNS